MIDYHAMTTEEILAYRKKKAKDSHKNYVSQKKQVTCSTCGNKRIILLSTFDKHRRNNKPYHCEICAKKLKIAAFERQNQTYIRKQALSKNRYEYWKEMNNT